MNAEEFSGFGHAVDADGEELLVHADETRIVNAEHTRLEIILHQLVIGDLIAVNFVDFCGQVAPVLNQAIHVNGDDVD